MVPSVQMSQVENWRKLFNSMPLIFAAVDDTYTYVEWNTGAEKLTGWKKEDIIGNPKGIKLLYPDEKLRAYIETIVKDQENIDGTELPVTCKDGSVKTIAWYSPDYKIDNGLYATWALGVDVTQRKVLEARWKTIMNAADTFIEVVDTELNIAYINQTLPGINMEDVIGKPHIKWLSKEDGVRLTEIYRRVIQTNKAEKYQTEGPGPDGQRAYYDCSATPLVEQERVTGVVVISTNITPQRHAQDLLKSQKQELEDINQFMVGRELKMRELKEEIRQLKIAQGHHIEVKEAA